MLPHRTFPSPRGSVRRVPSLPLCRARYPQRPPRDRMLLGIVRLMYCVLRVPRAAWLRCVFSALVCRFLVLLGSAACCRRFLCSLAPPCVPPRVVGVPCAAWLAPPCVPLRVVGVPCAVWLHCLVLSGSATLFVCTVFRVAALACVLFEGVWRRCVLPGCVASLHCMFFACFRC